MVARRQAQNAADAGALAGAVTLRDNLADLANARLTARYVVNRNAVWGEAAGDANIDVDALIACPGPGHPVRCIVNVGQKKS